MHIEKSKQVIWDLSIVDHYDKQNNKTIKKIRITVFTLRA
jgi:hypothetical protein